MGRIIFIFLILSQFAFSGEPDIALHEKCLYPTVVVLGQNPAVVGSGVIVKSVKCAEKYENYVFTCAHSLFPVPRIISANEKLDAPEVYDVQIKTGVYEDWSKLVGYKRHGCEIMHIDRERDIALIKFYSYEKNFVADIQLGMKTYIGNQILKIGCGINDSFRLDYGQITAVKDSFSNTIYGTYRINAPTIMGDSGGPVYHENKLLGLTKAVRLFKFDEEQNLPVFHISYVIPIEQFYESKEISNIIKGEKK